MRSLLLSILLLMQLSADDHKTPLFIGAGPYIQTQPYKGADAQVVPSPVIFFDNHLVYIRWSRVGIYVLGSSKKDFSWGISLTAQPRPFGYKSSDSPTLRGMSRNTSIEAGAALDMQYKDTFFNVVFFHDILNASNSYMARTEIGQHIKIDRFDLYPSLIAIYHAADFNNYYYGVKPSEATPWRSAYSPSSSVSFGFQTYLKYNLSHEWSALINFRADTLSKEEQNSPIVSDKYMFSGLISMMYRFEI